MLPFSLSLCPDNISFHIDITGILNGHFVRSVGWTLQFQKTNFSIKFYFLISYFVPIIYKCSRVQYIELQW